MASGAAGQMVLCTDFRTLTAYLYGYDEGPAPGFGEREADRGCADHASARTKDRGNEDRLDALGSESVQADLSREWH